MCMCITAFSPLFLYDIAFLSGGFIRRSRQKDKILLPLFAETDTPGASAALNAEAPKQAPAELPA